MSSGGERGRLRDGQGGHGGGDRVLRSLLDRAGVAVDGRGDAVDLVQLGLDPGGAGGAGHPADDELEVRRSRRSVGQRARRRHIHHLPQT